jgi:hypothetical protein
MRPPGELPTAGQRHGRDRRPAVRPWTTRNINVKHRQPADPESSCVTVDKDGNTADFLLRAHRDKAAARR